jgi:hypothetical protein
VVGVAVTHAGFGAVDRHDALTCGRLASAATSSRVMIPGGVRGLGAEPLR